MKTVSRWLVALALLPCLLALLVPVAYAADLPESFYGTVKINGRDAPIDTVVTAKFGATQVGTFTTTEDGIYGDTQILDYLYVQHDSLHDGDTVNFYVDGVDTGQSDQYDIGGGPTQLNLTVSISNYLASYSASTRATSCDNFQSYASHHTVYMLGTSFNATDDYKVAYYDGGDDKRATEEKTSSGSGNLTSQHTFVEGTDVAGSWHVVVSLTENTPPASYNASWGDTVASDGFTVQQSAIPEFPTIPAVVVSMSLCAGIYFWLRRKVSPLLT